MNAADLPEPYRAALTGIAGHFTILTAQLNVWAGRDDTRAQPDVRTAGAAALTETDRAIAGMHQLRARLVDEIRASDAAAMERSEQLLRRMNGENTEAGQ